MKSPLTWLIGVLIFLPVTCTLAQSTRQISGAIVDAQSREPLPFVAISVFKEPAHELIKGETASDSGTFNFSEAMGNYSLVFEIVGYDPLRKTVALEDKNLSLGTIALNPSAKQLDEVTVQGQKSTYELSLDKRIFNVGSDLANAGGTAVDILNNVPSISVNPEGDVSLRGSGNVRILIDGRPSGLVSLGGTSGLQQLQGSMIERVEVITNPSARYEAEGMGGIINIVLKKEQRQGLNGSFDIITGFPFNFGGAANVNFRHKDFNFFANYTIAYRKSPNHARQHQELYQGDTTVITEQTWERTLNAYYNNLRMGADYFITPSTSLTAAYTWRRAKGKRFSNINYYDYYNSLSNLFSVTNRTQDETETEPNSEYSLTFKKGFAKEGHEIVADLRYLDNWEQSDQLFAQTTVPFPADTPASDLLQHSLNDETEKQILFQLDYTRPFAKEGRFEAGVRSSLRDMTNNYFVAEEQEDGSFDNIPQYTNNFVYDENIHAAYAIYGNKAGKFSYQVGLRGEWSDVITLLRQTNERNARRYVNLFPSAHISYDLPARNAVQISYSRRIRRPLYNDLSPFMTLSDNRNFFSGNPDLNPEFTDSYDLGHIKYLEKGTITSSVYYRYTTAKILGIRRVDSTGYAYLMPENLATEHSYGLEITAALTPLNWFRVDGNVNVFRSKIDGSNLEQNFRSDTYSWLARLNTKFTVWSNTEIQLRHNYEGAMLTPQGSRKGVYGLDFAASRDVLNGNATITFNILDVFNSRRYQTITEGSNFYTYNSSLNKLRQINLTLNYRLHQAKTTKSAKTGEEF